MCCVPNDEERKQFDLPHAMRVFNALKKHKFEKENEIRAITYKREKETGLEVPFKFNFGTQYSYLGCPETVDKMLRL